MTHFSKSVLAALALVAAACGDAPNAPLAAPPSADVSGTPEQHLNARYPIRVSVSNLCDDSNEGEGELVTLEGAIHETYHVRRDAMGRTFIRIFSNPQMLQGTGWISGARYVATGNFVSKEFYVDDTQAPEWYSFRNTFQLTATGGDVPTTYIHVDGRIRFVDGEVEREIIREVRECR